MKSKKYYLITILSLFCLCFLIYILFSGLNKEKNNLEIKDNKEIPVFNDDKKELGNQILKKTYDKDIRQNNEILEETQDKHIDQKNIYYYYRIVQPLGKEGIPGFFEQTENENFLQNLKLYNDELNSTFNFFYDVSQFIQYNGNFNELIIKDADLFVLSPINQKIELENGDTFSITTLKTHMFEEKSFYSISDDVEQGRSFNKSDYVIENTDKGFNVILGNGYSKYLKIGDNITVNLFFKDIKLNIIGFFKKNSQLKYSDIESTNLDYHIVIPIVDFIDEPHDQEEERFQMFYYAMKNEGIIQVESDKNLDKYDEDYYDLYYKSIEGMSEKIKTIAKKYNLYYVATGTSPHVLLDK